MLWEHIQHNLIRLMFLTAKLTIHIYMLIYRSFGSTYCSLVGYTDNICNRGDLPSCVNKSILCLSVGFIELKRISNSWLDLGQLKQDCNNWLWWMWGHAIKCLQQAANAINLESQVVILTLWVKLFACQACAFLWLIATMQQALRLEWCGYQHSAGLARIGGGNADRRPTPTRPSRLVKQHPVAVSDSLDQDPGNIYNSLCESLTYLLAAVVSLVNKHVQDTLPSGVCWSKWSTFNAGLGSVRRLFFGGYDYIFFLYQNSLSLHQFRV